MQRKKFLTSDEVLDMPGTYYNPVTEILVTVDDSNYIDQSLINLDKYTGKQWILVSEDPLNDSSSIEETLQTEIELEGGPEGSDDISETAKEQQE